LYLFILLFRPKRSVKIFFASFFGFFFFIIALSEIHPTDTTTEPVDIAILQKDPDGKKRVVREYESEKTNGIYRDTVMVKDIFIFRKIYSR